MCLPCKDPEQQHGAPGLAQFHGAVGRCALKFRSQEGGPWGAHEPRDPAAGLPWKPTDSEVVIPALEIQFHSLLVMLQLL